MSNSLTKIRWTMPTLCLLLLLLYPLQAHAITLASIPDNGTAVEPQILHHKEKLYMIYEINIHAKLNGKGVTMMLDTGSDFSVISGNDVSKFGLGKLPVSI